MPTSGLIGGDLAAMSGLSQRFSQAGDTFSTQSTAISRRVGRALDEFVAEMRQLDGEARELAAEISDDMARLDAQAAETEWTGTNRSRMDTIVATLDNDIVQVHSAIQTFADEATAVVNGALSTAMNSLGTNTETAGANAQQVASNFGHGVDRQRIAFDRVLNG